MINKKKSIRIAIDSSPGGSLKSPRNYGALQLASLGSLPPKAPLRMPLPSVDISGGCDISIKDEGHKYILSPKKNKTGKQREVSGEAYLYGLIELAKKDIIVNDFVMKKASLSLSNSGDAIINFKERVPAFDTLLSSPAWIPFSSEPNSGWPGARQVSEISPNRWEAVCPNNIIPSIIIEVIRSPEENVMLYEEGIISQTADTATPFQVTSSSRGRRIVNKTALRAVLVFFGELAAPEKKILRQEIRDILKVSKCGEQVGWVAASAPSDDPDPLSSIAKFDWPSDVSRNGILLAYSDYYPNATVAWSIAALLHQNGILCTPVSDSYSAPKVKAVMRLMIISGPTDDAWGRYAALSLCPGLQGDLRLKTLYTDVLESPFFDHTHERILDDILDDLCPFVIVGAIPSVCLSNVNY